MPPRRPTPEVPAEPGLLITAPRPIPAEPGLLITAPRLIPASAGSGVLAPGYVAVAAGLVTEVGQGPPPRAPDLALDTGVLVPGLVDLQVNGYFGEELRTAGAAGWAAVAGGLTATGATSYLPTFITAPLQELTASLRSAAVIAAARPAGGARVLGVHLEGPFIAPSRRGAHNAAWIVPPSAAAIDELLAAGAGLVRLVTLAPELDGGIAAVRQLTEAGVLVSVGHSDATAEVVAAAAGASPRARRGRPGTRRSAADQRPDRGPAARGRAGVRDRVRRGARPDLPGHGCGGVRGHATRCVPARRRADRAAAGRRRAAGARGRHPGRLGAADGRRGGEHGGGRGGPRGGGRRGQSRSSRSDRPARAGQDRSRRRG